MKIAQAQIQMQSQHVYQHEQSKQESLKTWIGNERPNFEGGPAAVTDSEQGGGSDRLSLSEAALRHYLQKPVRRDGQAQTQPAQPGGSGEDPKLIAMRLILEALTGKKIFISSLEGYGQDSSAVSIAPRSQNAPDAPGQGAPVKEGWGLEYDSHEVIAEHEEMAFQAAGQVRTEDGSIVNVSLAMAMSRDFIETRDVQIRAGDAALVDPLVINFADQPPSLIEQKIAFDLNNDGASEEISFVGSGSGFLFLDHNNDGRATDGYELFGPKSGSGFAELADLDSDGNGWLDDNDPMFAKLQVWVKTAVDTDYFAALEDLNIGAILLDHQATPFSLNNQHNIQLGQITGSGLFLREGGGAGVVQEIRLAV